MRKEFAYADARTTGIVLSETESDIVEAAALRIAAQYAEYSLHSTDLLHTVELAAAALPSEVRRALISFRDEGNPSGTLVLRGLPLGALPPTPDRAEDEPHWTAVSVATLSQLMVMSVLGRSISYSDEKNGDLVQDVSPKRGAEERQENSGSILLELHTEDGFHPAAPHFLSLICLRGDRDGLAATVTGGIGDVLPELDEETVAALRRPEFRTKFSTSFVHDTHEEVLTPPVPVLCGARANPDLRVDFHGTVGTTPGARAALAALEDAVLGSLRGIVLEPGELIILDNRRTVHGRTGFTPRYDGADRWLRRSFALADLRPVLDDLGEGRSHNAITTRQPSPKLATAA
ncbi:TauD/TfdA family dioxygenase [Streptomyces sp. G-G2]|uniref:TauD/TfdA family dioxygenase n=1 Tax=Streptomyces sp. G-G2 TaxID=3046201 RepID=UPI0024B8F5F7|nr:TauD/TfdA family dioxygenase [Streptomyces sp. G-G2]MDJ0384276.1 TauD/TfdA family dioxygenase [Streptomyces sp. G-G2]